MVGSVRLRASCTMHVVLANETDADFVVRLQRVVHGLEIHQISHTLIKITINKCTHKSTKRLDGKLHHDLLCHVISSGQKLPRVLFNIQHNIQHKNFTTAALTKT